MKNYVFLKKSNLFLFLIFSLSCSAQYQISLVSDINQDIIYNDTITNKLIIKYGKNKVENDTICFFSEYGAQTGNLHLQKHKKKIIISFTYAPKYLDFDMLSFVYNRRNKDWILVEVISSRTNPLTSNLETKISKYKIPKKIKFSLKNNNFDQFQEMILDNKKYLKKIIIENIE